MEQFHRHRDSSVSSCFNKLTLNMVAPQKQMIEVVYAGYPGQQE